jgi:nucleotide-binding universal stress UspA family protein
MSCAAPLVKVGFSNVLVAIDFSDSSEIALRHGVAIARHYGAQFYLTHVVSSLGLTLAGGDAFVMAEAVALKDALRREKELVESGALAGLPHHLIVSEGEIWQEIQSIAERQHIDLIVLGTHGRTGLRKLVLGSIAEQIFLHATCPVLSVGPFAAPNPPANLNLRHVLYCTALSQEPALAAQYAASIAKEHSAELTLLHVVEPGREQIPDRSRVMSGLEQQMREQLPAATSLPYDPNFRVETGPIVKTILEVADDLAADLIVMDLHTPHGLAEQLRWRHAYPVICQARCPVLTVRSPRSF